MPSMTAVLAACRQSCHIAGGWVLPYFVEHDGFNSGPLQGLADALRMAGGDHAGVRDQQRHFHPDFGRQFPNALHGIEAKNQTGAGLVIERRKSRGGIPGTVHCCWGRCSCGNFDRPPFIEKIKQVAFVRLVPGDIHGGNGADVEAFDLGRFQQLFDERFVLRQGGHGQRRPDLSGASPPAATRRRWRRGRGTRDWPADARRNRTSTIVGRKYAPPSNCTWRGPGAKGGGDIAGAAASAGLLQCWSQ